MIFNKGKYRAPLTDAQGDEIATLENNRRIDARSLARGVEGLSREFISRLWSNGAQHWARAGSKFALRDAFLGAMADANSGLATAAFSWELDLACRLYP